MYDSQRFSWLVAASINRWTCASTLSGTLFSTSSCVLFDWVGDTGCAVLLLFAEVAADAAEPGAPSRPVSLCDIRRITLTARSFKTSFASTFKPSTASSAVTRPRWSSEAAAYTVS